MRNYERTESANEQELICYDCAKKLINAFPRLLENASGGYADIRKL